MVDRTIEFDIDPVARRRLHQQSQTDETSFAALVREFQLDPTRDFRHARLAGVDFTGSDLRGFDFTGADLRVSVGRNVVWDDTTTLTGATVDGSLFEYNIHRQAFFGANEDAQRILRSLQKEYWATSIQWVAERTKRSSKNYRDAMEIAHALFVDSDDQVVKSNILYFLSRNYDRRDEYLAFLLDTFNRHYGDDKIKRSVLKLLATLFSDRRSVFEIFKAEIEVATGRDQRQAIVAVVRSPFERSERKDIIDLVRRAASEDNRRAYVAEVAGRKGAAYRFIMQDPTSGELFDFDQEISSSSMKAIARRWLRQDAIERDAESRSGPDGGSRLDFTVSEIEERVAVLKRMYSEMSAEGVEFVVVPEASAKAGAHRTR